MLANFKIPLIEELKNLRAETMSNIENNVIANLAERYFSKQNEFKSITALNKYMTELSDDDFELFVEHILNIIEGEENA
tara:strand:+ start:2061 stop:2297 length:237 start_codon:yes stop_codon:yes gene_type:complete